MNSHVLMCAESIIHESNSILQGIYSNFIKLLISCVRLSWLAISVIADSGYCVKAVLSCQRNRIGQHKSGQMQSKYIGLTSLLEVLGPFRESPAGLKRTSFSPERKIPAFWLYKPLEVLEGVLRFVHSNLGILLPSGYNIKVLVWKTQHLK